MTTGNRKQKAWLMKLGNTIFISSSQFPTLYGLLITAIFPIKAGGASYTVLYPPSLPSRNLHVPSRLDNDSRAHFQHPPTVTIAIFPFSLMPTLQPLGGGCYITFVPGPTGPLPLQIISASAMGGSPHQTSTRHMLSSLPVRENNSCPFHLIGCTCCSCSTQTRSKFKFYSRQLEHFCSFTSGIAMFLIANIHFKDK